MRSICRVKQPIELISGLTYLSIFPINLSLVATSELSLYQPLPFTLATAHSRLQLAQGRASTTPTSSRAVVLAIVTYVSIGRIPMRSVGSVEQPIELLSELSY